MPRARRRLERAADRWLLPALVVLFHLATARGYGYFRDELYYLACARHLDFDYVDQPPLVAVIARLVSATLGTSRYALRFLPAVVAGATVWMAMEMARELGGGRWARLFAGLGTALAPVYLSIFSIYTMNAFDVAVWTACAWILVRVLAGGAPRGWIWFGVWFGIGLENKLSALLLGLGVMLGLVVARRWRVFRTREFWAGWGIAALLFLPHVAWQIAHRWPTLEFMRNATRHKNAAMPPAGFLGQLALHAGPFALPLVVAGILYFLTARRARAWRPLGWIAVAAIVTMTLAHGKPYYVAPIWAFVFAGGGVAVTALTPGGTGRVFRLLYLVLLVAGGVALAPLAKPLLPVERYVRYSLALGIQVQPAERSGVGRLPQHFADERGWQELAETVAGVYRSLPEAERARAGIYAENYGEAGAIDFFGPDLGLPHAISGHNSYFLWGPGDYTGEVMIVIGGSREELERAFEHVLLATTFTCRDCMPYENRNPIWVARGSRRPLRELWPEVRMYI